MTTIEQRTVRVRDSDPRCEHPRQWMVETKTRRVARRPCRVCAAEPVEQAAKQLDAV
jgi:hypothetical protein